MLAQQDLVNQAWIPPAKRKLWSIYKTMSTLASYAVLWVHWLQHEVMHEYDVDTNVICSIICALVSAQVMHKPMSTLTSPTVLGCIGFSTKLCTVRCRHRRDDLTMTAVDDDDFLGGRLTLTLTITGEITW